MGHHEWEWMVVVDLYLGGLGAGCLVLSALAYLSRRRYLKRVVQLGALIAPILVAGGVILLVFDLGRPLNSWRLYTAFNPVSPMWVGSWLLMLFCCVGFVNTALHFPAQWARRLGHSVGLLRRPLHALASWNTIPEDGEEAGPLYPDSPPLIRKLRHVLAITGVPLGVGVGIYTGVLLGAIPARPFWNTPMVAELFLFSALATASALMLLTVPRHEGPYHGHEVRILKTSVLLFLVLEIFIVIPFVVHGQLSTLSAQEALAMILGGPYTTVFWLGVFAGGMVVPLFLELFDVLGWLRLPRSLARIPQVVAALLVLVGGYLLRWVFVHAGQDTMFL